MPEASTIGFTLDVEEEGISQLTAKAADPSSVLIKEFPRSDQVPAQMFREVINKKVGKRHKLSYS